MKHFIIVLVIGLVLGFLLGKKTNKEVVINTVETIYDSIPYQVEVPTTHTITKIEKVEVPQDVDTASIVLDYFTKYLAVREWENEDIKVKVTDTITENRVGDGAMEYQILRPIIINRTTVQQPKRFITLEAVLPNLQGDNYALRTSYHFDNKLLSLTYRPQTKHFELGFGVKLFNF